ncbi:MAG: OmpA family protein [Pyrinomonadaceae bacterium]|nr:OmpA family protein [Blastocatellia bacterium]MCW5958015.1 OmpA family protein [Pyrinomonadaceae bacterium]
MSDNKNIPGPPPDDWTKTTPNVSLPNNVTGGSGGGEPDWAKTNYKIPSQAVNPDDFGKTITNIKPIETNKQDFGKTMYPGAAAQPPAADWGATQANANVNAGDFGASPSDWGPGPDKTTPYFQLPESERAKYQQLPPTPAEQAAQAAEEEKAKGGIPGWVWAVAGLMVMFFFAVAVLGIVYFFIIRDSSFKVTVKGAPPGSDILVDDKLLAVSNENGDSEIPNLAPGKRTITISHPSFTCQPIQVEGGRGVNPEPVIARCQAQAVKTTDDCANIQIGEEDKAERCYNAALDALPTPFTPEQLVKALNILIINFNTGSSEISPRRIVALKKGADFIKRLPADVVLEVGGHTDNVGQPGPNLALSEARASAVKDTLVKFGVNGSILQTRGYGSTKPRTDVDGNTELGKFLNRRIEYSIVKK